MNYWMVASSRSSDPESLAKYVDTIIHSMLSDQVAKMSVGRSQSAAGSRRSSGDKANGTSAGLRKCFYCKQEGHWINQCPKKLSMECFSCGQLGHTAKRCTNSGKAMESRTANM